MSSSNNQFDFSGLKATFVNCTLKRSPSESHTEGLMNLSRKIMEKEGVVVDSFRLVDFTVAPGVQPDMTKEGWSKDDWPLLFKRIISSDILVIGTPIWLGERSSEATKLIERMYAMSAHQNDAGQYIYYGKAGGCLITGNEDGVKHCSMGILYALQHIGYCIPPQADAGWVGEIGPGPSYMDEDSNGYNNEFTNRNTTFMSYNLMHLARIFKTNHGFPNYGNSRENWDTGSRWAFENPEYR